MDFFIKLIKLCINIAIVIIILMALAWLFLGLTPRQSYERAKAHINSWIHGAGSISQSVQNTADSMADTAKSRLNEAADRINGKDPYEEYNNRLMNSAH